MRPTKEKGGFTLMEIMVVVIIIAIIAAIVVPRYVQQAERAKVKATKVQIKEIEKALSLYKLDAGVYPTTSEGLRGLVDKPASFTGSWPKGGYIDSVPKDAWGRDFIYTCPGASGRDYDITSLGADGREGGEDENADISNAG